MCNKHDQDGKSEKKCDLKYDLSDSFKEDLEALKRQPFNLRPVPEGLLEITANLCASAWDAADGATSNEEVRSEDSEAYQVADRKNELRVIETCIANCPECGNLIYLGSNHPRELEGIIMPCSRCPGDVQLIVSDGRLVRHLPTD